MSEMQQDYTPCTPHIHIHKHAEPCLGQYLPCVHECSSCTHHNRLDTSNKSHVHHMYTVGYPGGICGTSWGLKESYCYDMPCCGVWRWSDTQIPHQGTSQVQHFRPGSPCRKVLSCPRTKLEVPWCMGISENGPVRTKKGS
jgi:hypothetical protein